ncbi:cell shape-determining protein [Clostridium sp.]|uniref:cell shape-determining protein n=1 Tax=Clostridium sp. TaxID=1506 RepID=UPI00283CF5B3|nr:cell shape-determining protein [Clostridium sp.]MDR3597407.1 cell shape-determining protein [Clostridium sp.]
MSNINNFKHQFNNNYIEEKNNRFGLPLTILVTVLEYLLLNYLLLIPLSASFVGVFVVAIILLMINAFIIGLFTRTLQKQLQVFGGLSVITIVILFVLWFFTTSPLLRADSYRKLAGDIETKNFSDQVSPIDLKQVPIVDASYARNLADKKLGSITALGSQVQLGSVTVQQVKGKLCYVIPLEHSGFFKWLSNKEGTPGYIVVSATDPDDVQLVTEINGNPLKIKYQPEAYFGTNIFRYAYYKDMFKGLTDFSFEIDDEGNPYWVVSEYEKSVGFNGDKVTGALIINAQTGETSRYNLDEIPVWVDRIMPLDIVNTNINNWGKLVHGVLNFSNKDKLQTTGETSTVYYNDQCYYYNGITSVGADESTVGFLLTNTRTNETTFFKVAGSTESASMQSAEGKVQNMGYTASSPILINVQDTPTYFLTLKDKKGLVKMYAMISVQNYNIVGIGETLEATMSNYIEALSNKNTGSLDTTGVLKEGQGTIERIGTLQTDKDVLFYIITKENPTTLLIAPANISKELPLTKEGDKFSYKYIEMKNTDITLKEFDNLNIDIK